jgi:thiamine pyrophosphate-dependent acetolactate synthase large subunit-like protein
MVVYRSGAQHGQGEGLSPSKVETLQEYVRLGDVGYLSRLDVGQQSQMWAAQYYKFNEPRRWTNSGGSTMAT